MADDDDIGFKVYATIDGFNDSMAQASSSVQQFSDQTKSAFEGLKGAFATLGIGLGVGEIISFAKEALEAANQLQIMSDRTGFAASTLSALNIPLKQNGSSVEDFANAMKFMSRNLEEANPKVVAVFDNLGLSITKLRSLTPEEQFDIIATALNNVHNQGQLTSDMMTIFGRGAAGLIPIIKNLNGSMEDWITHQKELGALTDEDVKQIHEWDDAWISAWEHFKIGAVEGYVALRQFMMESMPAYGAQNPNVSFTRPESVTSVTQDPQAIAAALKARGMPTPSAAGDNTDIPGQDTSAEDAAAAEQDAIEQGHANTQMELSKLVLEQKKADLQAEVDAGKITNAQKTAMMQDYTNQEYTAEMANADEQMSWYDEDEKEYQALLDKKAILTAQYNVQMAQIAEEGAKNQEQEYKAAFDLIDKDMDTMLTGVLQGTQTWQQAMAKVYDNLAISFIEAIAKMALREAAFQAASAMGWSQMAAGIGNPMGGGASGSGGIMMQLLTALGLVSTTTATSDIAVTANTTAIGTNVAALTANTAAVSASAGASGGGLFAAASAIPFMATGGTIMGSGLAFVHAGEQIIPTSSGGGINSGIGAASSQSTSGGGIAVTINLSAIDSQSGAEFLQSQGENIAGIINQQIRNGNPALMSQNLTTGRY